MAQIRYYNMINDRAKLTYTGPTITKENFHLWEDHWFVTAEALRDEFAAGGLTNTATLIQDIIDSASRYSKRKR